MQTKLSTAKGVTKVQSTLRRRAQGSKSPSPSPQIALENVALYSDNGEDKVCSINQCEPNPCQNGACTPSNLLVTSAGTAAGFVCDCQAGWTGLTCLDRGQDAPPTAIIVIGGYDGSSSLSSGERFDPAQNAWSPIASMGTARDYHAAAVIDGLLYAIGGRDGSGYLSSGERYDPAQNAWSPIASMGTARDHHAAAVIDGLLYAIGGYDGSSYLSSGERYDPAQNAWSPIASMGIARVSHAAVAL